MGTHVRLTDEVYQKIAAQKRENETFSEAIDRLTSDWSLAEWGERHAVTQEDIQSHLDAIEAVEEADREAIERTLAIRDSEE